MVDIYTLLQFVLDVAALLSIYLFLTLSLNIEYGYAGITNLGKVLFMAAGGYTIALVTPRLCQYILNINITEEALRATAGVYATEVDLPVIFSHLLAEEANHKLMYAPVTAIAIFLVSLIIAMVVGGLVGILASLPAVRLRTDYLAISLLALAEIVRVLGINYKPFQFGTQIPDVFVWAGPGFMRYLAITLTMVLMAFGVFLYTERLARSPLSRVLRSMRDNQSVTESLGRDTTRLKVRTLFVGSAISALGGALYGFYSSNVVSAAYSRIPWTFWPYLMLIVGGAGNNAGALLGCVVFVLARRLINLYKDVFAFLPFDPVWIDYMLLGVVLLVMLTRRPEGILPEKPTTTLGHSELEAVKERTSSSKNILKGE